VFFKSAQRFSPFNRYEAVECVGVRTVGFAFAPLARVLPHIIWVWQ